MRRAGADGSTVLSELRTVVRGRADDGMTTCHRCSGPLAGGQEYCLRCGTRRRGPGRFGRSPLDRSRLVGSVVALAAIAVVGAASAVWATREAATATTVITALGGNVRAPSPPPAAAGAADDWPAGLDGWTVVLADVPRSRGRAQAVALARTARRRGVAGTGVADSSRYPSLQPGYWVVFAGRFTSESEARATLGAARKASRTARVQRIVG